MGDWSEPDLVQSAQRPRSRRTNGVATVLAALLIVLAAWHTVAGGAKGAGDPVQGGSPVAHRSAGSPTSPASPAAADSPLPSAAPMGADLNLPADRQATWLATLPRGATRPPTYTTLSSDNFRISPSDEGTGGEDFAAVAQLRNAAGRWVNIARGSFYGLPPLDGSGKYFAFTIDQIRPPHRRPQCWVYVVSAADGRVIKTLLLDNGRYVAGWLGDRVVLGSHVEHVDVRLLDWRVATPVLDDLGPDAWVLTDPSGDITLVTAGGDEACLVVWHFAPNPRGNQDCPADQILAMSADGRYAITQGLHWVRLNESRATRVGGRPDGVVARSASFLADGRALVDLTLDGTHVTATLLCSRTHGCQRVPTRTELLRQP
jgi:hypothetical protein